MCSTVAEHRLFFCVVPLGHPARLGDEGPTPRAPRRVLQNIQAISVLSVMESPPGTVPGLIRCPLAMCGGEAATHTFASVTRAA